MIAIDILRWPGFNQAFLASLIGSTLMVLAVIPYGKRRPMARKATWGESMLASVYLVFGLFLAFGVTPNEFIKHADQDLGWDRANIIFGPGGILRPQSEGGWNPITLQYQAVRDVIVVLIHVYFFVLLLAVWAWWQKREKPASKELETSTYGRPLVKKG